MNALVRRSAALCALGALTTVLVGCSGDARPVPAERPPAASRSAPPTLAPGPQGLTPVFENGPRTHGRTVALTFDADMTAGQGPRAAAGERFDNPALVATLRRLKVPATFFMTGRWADEYPSQAADIGRDPLFEVANHSYSHYAFTGDCYGLPTVPPARMRADMERAFAAFRTAGVERSVPYFRFPGGCYDQRALRALAPGGVTAVQWDVVGGDAFATDPAAVARQVLDGVRPGSVVVLHSPLPAPPAPGPPPPPDLTHLRNPGDPHAPSPSPTGTAGAPPQPHPKLL
ncbi:polysaccharide deacetylase family protein, partial [Streptomyces alfalfae]